MKKNSDLTSLLRQAIGNLNQLDDLSVEYSEYLRSEWYFNVEDLYLGMYLSFFSFHASVLMFIWDIYSYC